MKQLFIQKGDPLIDEVPAPSISENEVLVKVNYSCISAGTELHNIHASGRPLYRKVMDKPQDLKKVLNRFKSHGLGDTLKKVKGKIESKNPIGYSASGIVIKTGAKIKRIKKGDKVACAGDRIANHAEYIAVPENLAVKLPDKLDLKQASTVALGSIAMQGIRRCDPKLGENIVVVGLGILGQLVSQMLKMNGCRVIGIDIDQGRIDRALSLGLYRGINPAKEDIIEEALKNTDGYGADSVIITAASKSEKLINEAMGLCRKKGRVVIIGNIVLNIDRDIFYEKELDILISTSYGPGRYDEMYEKYGFDYPYSYVRWTENRNMKEYLEVLSTNSINIDPIIDDVYKFEEAPDAYKLIDSPGKKPMIVLLEYDKESEQAKKINLNRKAFDKEKINIGIIGAGNFTQDRHLPTIERLKDIYDLRAVCSKTGSKAKAIASQYEAGYATSDYQDILSDKDIDMVLIATRHNLHAAIAEDAVKKGKMVFLEKPMALNAGELKELVKVIEEKKTPFMVGYNRRFSPFSEKIKERTAARINPMIIDYRVNAGFIPLDSWVHNEEGGGRNIGEACHMYDLFNFLTDSRVLSINAKSIDPSTEQISHRDNFIATIKYEDGSVCNLVYTSLGAPEAPKEIIDIFVDGTIISLNDFKELRVSGKKGKDINSKVQNKGLYEELLDFGISIKNGNNYPIPLWQLVQASEISFKVEKKISSKI